MPKVNFWCLLDSHLASKMSQNLQKVPPEGLQNATSQKNTKIAIFPASPNQLNWALAIARAQFSHIHYIPQKCQTCRLLTSFWKPFCHQNHQKCRLGELQKNAKKWCPTFCEKYKKTTQNRTDPFKLAPSFLLTFFHFGPKWAPRVTPRVPGTHFDLILATFCQFLACIFTALH